MYINLLIWLQCVNLIESIDDKLSTRLEKYLYIRICLSAKQWGAAAMEYIVQITIKYCQLICLIFYLWHCHSG